MSAKLLAIKDWSTLGEKTDKSILPDFKIKKGTVVHIDNFGLVKIFHPKLHLKEGDMYKVYVNGEYKLDVVYVDHMKVCEDGVWTLYPGSSLWFLPEIGRVRSKNSAKELNVNIGDVITWEKI